MIAALFFMIAQDVPVPTPSDEGEEIVVQATYGLTTMLFDKGSDGRLRNCRVMVSSGSQRRDTAACQATPICFAGTATTVTDCVAFTAIGPSNAPRPLNETKPTIFSMPSLVQPKPADPTAIGPSIDSEESRETARQRVKLPPLPQAPTNGPVVRITNAQDK